MTGRVPWDSASSSAARNKVVPKPAVSQATLSACLVTSSSSSGMSAMRSASDRVRALAERIALMPDELLEVTKQALNVAWDTAGFGTTLLRAAELDALSHGTRPVIGFWDQVVSD